MQPLSRVVRCVLIACCVFAAAVPASAGAQVVSFTTEGGGVLHAGPRSLQLAQRPTRVELARVRDGWVLAVGGRTVRRFDRRPHLRIGSARVTDRLAGRGTVTLLGSRLLSKAVQPGWLPGVLARTGAWMRGMPAAALWRMARLDRRRRAAWSRRAIAATLHLRGSERTDTHDIGFLYGEAAAYGYDAGCRRALRRPFTAKQCSALRTSALAAADGLAAMIRANAPAPLLPTHVSGCPDCPPGARETIIDSMMNVGLLVWAERRAGRTGYTGLATRHAAAVAGALIRADGCTSQATFSERSTGWLFGVHTHQGISGGSTWARGQAWAILGFARLAHHARDSWAAGVARALAGCWLAKVPAPRGGALRPRRGRRASRLLSAGGSGSGARGARTRRPTARGRVAGRGAHSTCSGRAARVGATAAGPLRRSDLCRRR